MTGNQRQSSSLKRWNKIKNSKVEKKTIFLYLLENDATASMISFETGIARINVIRNTRDLEQDQMLYMIAEEPCQLTSHRSWYITTDVVFRDRSLDQFKI